MANSTLTKPGVQSKHPQYKKAYKKWERIRDFVEGEDCVKAKGTKYLPKPSCEEGEDANKRYTTYRDRAVFYNATGHTKDKMVGQCFAIAPVYTGPEELKPILDDLDGSGVSCEQQSKEGLGNVVSFSRFGLFTDYPKTTGPVSKLDAETGGIRAKVLLYEPWKIINWNNTLVGAISKLSLVVIEEEYGKVDADGFTVGYEPQYRVLRLTGGVYMFEIWRNLTDGTNAGWGIAEKGIPTDSSGQTFDEIPFQFVGAWANSPTVEKPLLEDIASLNAGHYRNSADYEEMVFITGQATPWASGLSDNWVEKHMGGRLAFGSRGFVPLPVDGEAGLIEAKGGPLPKEAMDQKEALMISLGARMVEKIETARTATETGINEASSSSILAGCCQNVGKAYAKALTWACRFMGIAIPKSEEDTDATEGRITYELNTKFAISRMTPEEQTGLLTLYTGKLVSFTEARTALKGGGIAYMEDEKVKEEMDAELENDMMRAKQELDAQTASQIELEKTKQQGKKTPVK